MSENKHGIARVVTAGTAVDNEESTMNPSILLATSGQSMQNVSIFDPASPPAQSIVDVSVLVLAICAFIFLVVEGVLLYSVIRFRRPSKATTSEPAQVYGSQPIEIAWTAAPAMIVFVLVLVTVRTLWTVKAPPPQPQPGDNALFVTVVGKQWWWEYTYDHYNGEALGFITANELHVPASEKVGVEKEGVSRPVYLTLKSADVSHSFWVPRLAGKTDLIPGRTNHLWFQTDQSGLYVGQCAEYCGTQHAHMLLRVYVDPRKEFESWLAHQRKPAVDDPSVRSAKAAFLRQSCVNCHRVRGTSAKGTYAPDLTHLMSRETLASGMIPNTPEKLKDWVDDPQQIKSGCLMPAFGLDKSERDLVVRYLLTLR
jgi:cytochrome c oxidase subunit 2